MFRDEIRQSGAGRVRDFFMRLWKGTLEGNMRSLRFPSSASFISRYSIRSQCHDFDKSRSTD